MSIVILKYKHGVLADKEYDNMYSEYYRQYKNGLMLVHEDRVDVMVVEEVKVNGNK